MGPEAKKTIYEVKILTHYAQIDAQLMKNGVYIY